MGDYLDKKEIQDFIFEQSEEEIDNVGKDEFESAELSNDNSSNKHFFFIKGNELHSNIVKRRWWEEDMNYLFGCEDEGYWSSIKGFASIFSSPRDISSAIRAIVYETLSSIKIEDGLAVETTNSLNSVSLEDNYPELRDIAIFACFDPKNPDATLLKGGEEAVVFLGKYKFDKGRSVNEGNIVFKLIDESISITTCDTNVIPESLEKYMVKE